MTERPGQTQLPSFLSLKPPPADGGGSTPAGVTEQPLKLPLCPRTRCLPAASLPMVRPGTRAPRVPETLNTLRPVRKCAPLKQGPWFSAVGLGAPPPRAELCPNPALPWGPPQHRGAQR